MFQPFPIHGPSETNRNQTSKTSSTMGQLTLQLLQDDEPPSRIIRSNPTSMAKLIAREKKLRQQKGKVHEKLDRLHLQELPIPCRPDRKEKEPSKFILTSPGEGGHQHRIVGRGI
ncbi:hypothetical protein J1N35_041019 [Gossypium stocksii]|uniref:Uncharacterized protein n=1 Tax=Gossypium stocksii TaxID=47602 RepID=A0A9D3UEP2_9ROSI|nr:hypothetical protein J1N35_041019 [Gossypium stocksii]